MVGKAFSYLNPLHESQWDGAFPHGVVVFGAGFMGRRSVFLLLRDGVKVLHWFDNDSARTGKTQWDGLVCEKPKHIQNAEQIPVVVAILNDGAKEAVRTQCEALGFRQFFSVDAVQIQSELDETPDEEFLRFRFYDLLGKMPNLENPTTFNEKMQWLKLHDRKPLYTTLVDKFAIKQYVAEKIGGEYVIPLYGVWDSAEEIDFERLPSQFVLKCTHDGGIIACRDKQNFDVQEAKAELEKRLKRDYYLLERGWPYKNVKRKIICEQYMGENLTDYKSYCFNGKLQYTFVWENESRRDGRKPEAYFCGAYDRNWEKTGLEIGYPKRQKEIQRPALYEQLVQVCETLSNGIPFVRVDCYCIHSSIFVGEMTFHPWAGFQVFEDEKWDYYLGSLLELPKS